MNHRARTRRMGRQTENRRRRTHNNDRTGYFGVSGRQSSSRHISSRYKNQKESHWQPRRLSSLFEGTGAAEASDTHKRVLLVVVLFLIAAIIFLGRLLFLQVGMADHYAAMAEETRTINFSTTPRRGTIYDRNGIVLATSVEATTIYANPAEIENPNGVALALCGVLGGTVNDYLDKLTQGGSTFTYIQRQVEVDVANAVKDLNLPGIYFIDDTRREYPNGSTGAQVVGYCDVDGNGICGLELQYDDILKGTPGRYVAERGRDGMPIPGGVKLETKAVDGEDIMISLDIKLQHSVEEILQSGVAPLGASGGSSVIMDSSTGEIYATCSLPYMDPTNMKESPAGSDQVKTITQAYEPGSIFKLVSAASVLEHNVLTPESEIYAPAALEADEYVITDSHDRGDETMTLRQVIAESSNVGISLATKKMGFGGLYESIKKYHLDEITGVDYPGEATGSLLPLDQWALVTSYNISFGQGIATTPLQITRFYGAVANDGVAVTPHFLISKPQSGEKPTYGTERFIDDQQDVEDLSSMLRSVVTDGTGTAADIEGFEVVGKTSTAEIASGGTYMKDIYNLAFVGFLDHSSSPLVCFVGATEVPSQSQVTEIFHDIMANAIEQYHITPM